MAQPIGKLELFNRRDKIYENQDRILKSLSELDCIEHAIWALPQLRRGDQVPLDYRAEHIEMDIREALSVAVRPQQSLDHSINIPQRYLGYIRFCASFDEYCFISKLVSDDYKHKRRFLSLLGETEPNWRKRGELSKLLLGDTLIQTFNRKIPLANYNSIAISQSWCRSNSSINRLDKDKVKETIIKHSSDLGRFELESMLSTIENEDVIYKVGKIKAHPQHVIEYLDNGDKCTTPAKKSHSPILVIGSKKQKEMFKSLRYTPLSEFKSKDISKPTNIKVQYEPILRGFSFLKKTTR